MPGTRCNAESRGLRGIQLSDPRDWSLFMTGEGRSQITWIHSTATINNFQCLCPVIFWEMSYKKVVISSWKCEDLAYNERSSANSLFRKGNAHLYLFTMNSTHFSLKALQKVKPEVRTGSCPGSQNWMLYQMSAPEVVPEVRTRSCTGSQNRKLEPKVVPDIRTESCTGSQHWKL